MQLIASDTDTTVARMLDGYRSPAILVTPDYRILAANDRYIETFGDIEGTGPHAYCYRVSHGYDKPCDQSGESCPLAAARVSRLRERVLHIHQTPRGEEHVDVEMLPIAGPSGDVQYFVELLTPVPVAGAAGEQRQMVGTSAPFNAMLGMLARVAPTDAAVLLRGESGTGKELAARTLHEASHRRHKALVTLECAGLNESLFESELFGHRKGAFTGANYHRQGLVEAAHGGTLFLDEVGDIPLAQQVKLLRLIETGTFRPVGETEVHHADFRLVCATHKNLEQMVEAGEFRRDLYYRINVFPIHLPALAERIADLPLLARSILEDLGGKQRWHLTESAMELLRGHHYQGNIRELRNILARAVILANTNVVDHRVIEQCLPRDPEAAASGNARLLPATPADSGAFSSDLGRAMSSAPDVDLKSLERAYLEALLRRHGQDRKVVAAIAGISVRSLYRKLRPEAGPPSPQRDYTGSD